MPAACSAPSSATARSSSPRPPPARCSGAFLGSEVGKSLDRADQLYAGKASYEALEYAPAGAPVAWQNPDSGHYGSVTPIRTWQAAGGEYCREFQQQAAIGGEIQAVYGTACRQPDGQWQVVD